MWTRGGGEGRTELTEKEIKKIKSIIKKVFN